MSEFSKSQKKPINFGVQLIINVALLGLGFIMLSLPFELGVKRALGLVFPVTWFWICAFIFRWLDKNYRENNLPSWSLSLKISYLICLWMAFLATFGFLLLLVYSFIT